MRLPGILTTVLAGAALFRSAALSAPPPAPLKLDQSLRAIKNADQPAGPFYKVNVETHGVLGPNNRNAFFSFSSFSIPTNSEVEFSSQTPVRNVLLRVTGTGETSIDGPLISKIAGANFFLINPNGIVIGRNASFDVSGSMVMTTADEVRFKEATFSTRNGGNSSAALLTTANPIAFGFLRASPGNIRVSGLAGTAAPVQTLGKTVSLIGGNITLENSTLSAQAGRINLVGVAGAGEVKLDAGLKSRLSVDRSVASGEISLTGGSVLQLNDGGSLYVRGRSFAMDGEQTLVDARTQFTAGRKAIDIDVSGAVSLTRGARIDAGVFGQTDGASINIRSGSLTLSGDARLSANLGTQNDDGKDGNISLQNADATGRGGDVNIRTGRLLIEEKGTISALAFGPGPGGNIDIDVTGQAVMRGPAVRPLKSEKGLQLFTGLIAKTDDLAVAGPPGGAISVRAESLTLLRGASIASTTKTARAAGNVTLSAGRITIDGTGRDSLTGVEARAGDADNATGPGGNVIVQGRGGAGTSADSLRLIDGGVLSASTFGRGDGGSVIVHARRILMDGPGNSGFTGLFARSSAVAPTLGNSGEGGDVSVFGRQALLRDGAQISASSRGVGNAGSVDVHVQRLTLDHAALGAAAKQSQRAGDVVVDGALTVTLLNHSALTTESDHAGGSIHITARDVVRVDNSLLAARSQDPSLGVRIDPEFVVLQGATVDVRGGLIPVDIIADNLLVSKNPASVILTGKGELRFPPGLELLGQLISQPHADLASQARLSEACGMKFGGGEGSSTFLITGRAGTPLEPGGIMPALEFNWRR